MRPALMLVVVGTVVFLLGGSTSPVTGITPPGLQHFVDKLATPVLTGEFFDCAVSNVGNTSAHVTISFTLFNGGPVSASQNSCGATLDPQKSCDAFVQVALEQVRCEIHVLAGNPADLRGILEAEQDLAITGQRIIRLAEAR